MLRNYSQLNGHFLFPMRQENLPYHLLSYDYSNLNFHTWYARDHENQGKDNDNDLQKEEFVPKMLISLC